MRALLVGLVVSAGLLVVFGLVWVRNEWPASSLVTYLIQLVVAVVAGAAVWRLTHGQRS